ncbi:MAG: MurR/RpiR family transcriptional regulator [Xanthomonadales bacterium]|jgi:DNA-binding MurR/RpiR family transcriptional regulator|nr:MurR/RpiR family transcriptional regulator [Xanthomonadales bacterium]
MSCLVKIRAFQDELSPNERKIARFILESPALIRDYSSQNLANSVGVSQSSIVKFSQKLGYQGFPDLKLAIHEAVLLGDDHHAGVALKKDVLKGGTSVKNHLYHIKTEALRNTMELNEEKRLLAAVDVLERSKRIQIIALGAGSMAARNFASMLIQIGKSVIAEVDTYIQLSSVATLGKDDTAFLISFSGQSPRMLEIVKQAKKAGATIVTLTNYNANPMRSLADVQLYSVSRVGEYEVPQIVSSTSQQFVIDLLFSQLVRRSPKARELVARSRQAVESL